MTPNQFREFLLNDTSGKSYAYLISCKGETAIKTIMGKTKSLKWPSSFRTAIIGTSSTRNKELKNLHFFLKEHYYDLEITILESSSQTHFPTTNFNNLCVKYKPTLKPEAAKAAEQRIFIGKNENYERTDAVREYNTQRKKEERKKHPLRARINARRWRDKYPERAKESLRRWREKHPEYISPSRKKKKNSN